jgi:thiol-disulfide isomerase/thioredoxin
MPKLVEWQAEFAEHTRFVYISDGTAEANRKKMKNADGKALLLQTKREVAEMFRAKWTPMAVLMNPRGRIASFTAAGDAGIRELIDGLRARDPRDPAAFFPGNDYRSLEPLRLGESLPTVEASDADGNRFSTEDVKGRETLLTFWSSTCQHCVAMMEQIKEWDASKNGTGPEMVIFAHRKEGETLELDLKSRVIPVEDMHIGGDLGQHGTPSAILIDENGRYISETAIGAEDIWTLVGKRF